MRIVLLSLVFVLLAVGVSWGQTTGDYQTAGACTFASATNWERYNGSAFVAAASAPSSADGVITIRNGHTATVSTSTTITLDQVVVNTGGNLSIGDAAIVTIPDGVGTDVDVSGTFTNQGFVTLNGQMSWQVGATITITNSTSVGTELTVNGTLQNQTNATWNQTTAEGRLNSGGSYIHMTINSATNPFIFFTANGGATLNTNSTWIYRSTSTNAQPSMTHANRTYGHLRYEVGGVSWTSGAIAGGTTNDCIVSSYFVSTGVTLNFNSGGPSLRLVTTGSITINGSMTNVLRLTSAQAVTGSGTIGFGTGSILTYNSSAAAAAITTGLEWPSSSGPESVVINLTGTGNPSLSLSAPRTLNTVAGLLLTAGRLVTTTTNLLSIGSAGSVSSSGAGYIDGPMDITVSGAQTRNIATGSLGVLRRSIQINSQGGLNTTFRVDHVQADPTVVFGATLSGLSEVSRYEYWTVDRTSGAQDATIGMDFTTAQTITATESDLRVARWSGTQWENAGPGVGGSCGGNCLTNGGSVISDVVSSFSPFALASFSGPLPVTWLGFSARRNAEGGEALLNWATASEINNRGFEVQRSAANDFAQYEVLGFVNGAGTTPTRQDYTYRDAATPTAGAYYRLKQIDFDGKFEYSATAQITALGSAAAPSFALAPNPTSGDVYFVVANDITGGITGDMRAELYSSQGIRVVATQGTSYAVSQVLSQALSQQAPGIYTLRVQMGAQQYTQRIVRQ